MNPLIDALEYATSVLDKPGRAVRGGLAGRPDELAAILPFSDTAGWTDPSRRVSGEDLLRDAGVRTGSETGDWLAGMGVEMALDPTNLVGLGFAPRGVKALRGAGRMAGETADDAINALKFAVEPGVEAFARPPGDVLRRTAGLDVRPDVLPTLSQVGGGTGDEWELALRGNLASENMARRPGVDPSMRFEDLPQFPDAPPAAGVTERYLPPFQGYESYFGAPHLTAAETSTLAKDMAMEGRSLPDIHAAQYGLWEDFLRQIGRHKEQWGQGGGVDSQAFRLDQNPEWRSALVARLAELAAERQGGKMMGLSDEFLANSLRQENDLRMAMGVQGVQAPDLGSLREITTPGHVGDLYDYSFRAKPDQLEDALSGLGLIRRQQQWYPSGFQEGGINWDVLERTRLENPMFAVDPAAAASVTGRSAADRTASSMREALEDFDRYGNLDYDQAELLARDLYGETHNSPEWAIKGALRLNPELRQDYPRLLAAIDEALGALPGGERLPLVPVPPDVMEAARRALAERGMTVRRTPAEQAMLDELDQIDEMQGLGHNPWGE